MPSIRKAKKTKVQIDANWLLGPDLPPTIRPPRRNGLGTAIAILFLFSGVGAVAYYWEPWSRQVLRWQWERWLHAQETDEDTLAALIALGDTVDDSTLLLLQQLQSENTTRRTVAFQVLKTQCESPSFRKMDDRRQNEIVVALEQWKPKDPDGRMMREWVAARMTSLLASSNPTKIELRKRLTQILDSAPSPIGSLTSTTARSMLLAGTSTPAPSETAPIKPAVPSLPNPSPLPNVLPTNELRNTTAPEAKPATIPGQPSAGQPATAPREPTRIRIASESHVRTVATSRSMSLSDHDEDEPITNKKMSVVINVKPKRSVEQLLKSLEHVPDEEVAGIIEELQSQGFSEVHVDLAVALARGESGERLEALSLLVNDATINPLPWLTWMSESEDQTAKRKAIAMLGSMADPEAVRILRIIEQRESDPRAASHIQQALEIHRAAKSTTR